LACGSLTSDYEVKNGVNLTPKKEGNIFENKPA